MAKDFYDKPASVEKIHVDGVTRTKNDLLKKLCSNVFKAKTGGEMVAESYLVLQKMKALQLVRDASVKIDVSQESPIGYEVRFSVKEFGLTPNGYLGYEVGNNEGGPVVTVAQRNAFGRAERVGINYQYGTQQASKQLYCTKPLNADPSIMWVNTVQSSTTEYPWSSYKEISRGGSTALNFVTRLGEHSLRYDGTWRELKSLTKSTDMSVREQAGHSIKSGLTFSWMRDKRDHAIFPTQGYLLGSTLEVAGLGGDAKYIKKDSKLQLNKTLFEHYVVQLSLAGGWLKSLSTDGHVHLSDRFYMGGPVTMRGFNINGCGPKAGECSVGGNAYCLAAAHLYSPLPFRAGKGGLSDIFRLHAWASAGNVLNLDYSRLQLAQLGQDLKDGMRLSYGVGIAASFMGNARIELNYCFPFRAHPNDSSHPGWQFGVGLTFL